MKPRPKVKRSTRPIHARIAKLREAANLTQAQLAERIGIDHTAVSHWETGLSSPKSRHLPVIARALGTTVDALLAA